MNTIDAIKNRHSYRGKYTGAKVPREDLVTILEAGLMAPSGCNKQTTSLICVDDPEVLKKVMGVIDPPVAETAPALICVRTKRIIAYRDSNQNRTALPSYFCDDREAPSWRKEMGIGIVDYV